MDLSEITDKLFRSGLGTFHVVSIVLLIFGIFFFVWTGKTRPKGRTVLIIGPVGAGKTTLFHRLHYGSTLNGTVASMEAREAAFGLRSDKAAGARPVNVVDVPGHPRVRDTWLAWQASARGIVFMVDSADFLPHKAAIAEHLYDVLTNPTISGLRVPILLVCNKADLGVKAHSVDFIRKRIERELDELQSTRASLEEVGGGRAVTTRLLPDTGPEGEPFTFAALKAQRGQEVSVVAISAQEGDGSDAVEAFIRRCVPV